MHHNKVSEHRYIPLLSSYDPFLSKPTNPGSKKGLPSIKRWKLSISIPCAMQDAGKII